MNIYDNENNFREVHPQVQFGFVCRQIILKGKK